jgi:hypothetical protein
METLNELYHRLAMKRKIRNLVGMKIKNKKKYRLAEQLLDELVNDTL